MFFIATLVLGVNVDVDGFCTLSLEDKSAQLDLLDCSNVRTGKAEELLETLDSCNTGGGIFYLLLGEYLVFPCRFYTDLNILTQ